jgi:hypothetical protein
MAMLVAASKVKAGESKGRKKVDIATKKLSVFETGLLNQFEGKESHGAQGMWRSYKDLDGMVHAQSGQVLVNLAKGCLAMVVRCFVKRSETSYVRVDDVKEAVNRIIPSICRFALNLSCMLAP